jgi:flagellar biosynthesis/type III secretory pathway protein FliH
MAQLQKSFYPGMSGSIALNRVHEANEDIPAKPVLRAGIRGNASLPVDTEEEAPLNAQEQLILRKEIIREYDALRQQYIAEGEKSRADAQEWSQRLIETTENDIRKLYANNEQECVKMKKDAEEQGYKDGYDRGYSEGSDKGYNEGYGKGTNECRETLEELQSLLERIDAGREKFFKEHENRLFDAIFTIANKITVDSLKQKDKTVITKMLKEAAKSFRNSEYIKITLSKIDVERCGEAGLDTLREVFRESQFIEFEVVKDAPEGTMIIDNGSEITDAGVATQLMMIEKLGKGKFRDKAEDSE